MDQMLQSAGFASIGNLLDLPEEDQQVLPQTQLQQEKNLQMSSLISIQKSNSQPKVHASGLANPHSMMQPKTHQPTLTPSQLMLNSLPQSQTLPTDLSQPHSEALYQAHSSWMNMLPSTSGSSTTPVDKTILPQLQNVVSTVNLGCKLDLKKIAMHARNAEYNPRRIAAVIMRIREPRTTALIFGTGKLVCTGAKSEDASRLAARKHARIIQKLGFHAKFVDFKIQNMVASFDVGFAIRLEGLALTHGQFASYEPELFPGLIYRMVKPKIVVLIFVSGKVVIIGAKKRPEIYEAFNSIHPLLKSFKK